jgi:hypothetical protein
LSKDILAKAARVLAEICSSAPHHHFQAKLDAFVGDLKMHIMEFVENTYAKTDSAKKG